MNALKGIRCWFKVAKMGVGCYRSLGVRNQIMLVEGMQVLPLPGSSCISAFEILVSSKIRRENKRSLILT